MKTAFSILIATMFSLSLFSQSMADYVFTSSAGTYTAITGGTSILAGGNDDTESALTNIGFTFYYDGYNFTQFSASPNGYICLGAVPSALGSPLSVTPNAIAFCGGDAETNTDVTYQVSGTAPNRVFTIQYPNWYVYYSSTTETLNAQIKLYETTGVIQIVYGSSTHTSGYSRQAGLSGDVVTDFSIRTTTTSWSASAAATANTDQMTWSATVFPANGLTYTWTPSTCISPSALTATNITTSQADVSWTSTGNLWNVQYGTAGFVLGTGTTVTGLTTAGYTITGLNASSAYQFYVQNDCGTEQSNWSGPYTFNTLCNTTTATYIQNFDGVTAPALPNCWSSIVIGSGGVPTITTVTTTPYSSPNCVQMYNATSVGGSTYLFLISPRFSDLASGGKQVRFRAKYSGPGTPVLNVGTMSNPTNQTTYTNLYTSYAMTSNWQEFVIPFTYSGTDQYIVIKHGLGTTTQYIYIDNFTWEPIPTCPWPTALQASAIQSNQATLAWTEMGSATAWQLEYGATGHTPGAGTIVTGVTTNPRTVTGLSNQTVYDFYVRSVCAPGDTSTWSGPISITTLCGPTNATYIQNFDGATTPDLPNCWNKIVIGSGGTPTISTVTASPYSAPNCVQMYNATSVGAATHLLLVSPQFTDLASGGKQVRFQAKMTGPGTPVLIVGTMSDPANQTTFTSFFTSYAMTANWQEFVIPVTYSGTDQFIAIKHGLGTTNQYIYIDNFTWEPVPTCPWPTALQASAIQSNQATFAWTEMGSATAWQLEYGATGHTPGAGTIVTGVTTNPRTVTGLSSQTVYDFYVRSVCAPGDTSTWSGPVSITTLCGPTTATYIQNFDGVATPDLPNCWNKIVIGTGTPTITTVTTSPYSSPNCVQLYNASAVGAATHLLLVSPQFSDLASGNKQVRFQAKMTGSGTPVLIVGTMSDPANQTTFTPLFTSYAMTSSWQEFIFSFDTYSGTDRYVAIKHGLGTTYQYVYIDNFTWDPIPSCPWPTFLQATAIEDVQVVLNWTENGSATEWEIEYGPLGFTPGTGAGTSVPGIATIPYTVTGLTATTQYSFYVRSVCSPGDTSTWTGPLTITTACSPVTTLPWTESFEAVTIPAFPSCWFMENGDWVTTNNINTTYDADAHTGTQFLRDTYGATNEFMWTPGFQLTGGESYDLKFWWAGDDYAYWVGDVFRNTVQSSAGATQLGTSFVTAIETTTKTYQQEKYTFIPPANGIYYFAIRINCSSSPWYISLDDFSLIPTPQYDLRLLSWDAPSPSGCSIGVESIVVRVQNIGVSSITNPGIAYQINGGAIVRDTLYGTLIPGQIDTLTFQDDYDFSVMGVYQCKAFIDDLIDDDNSNDTIAISISSLPYVNTYPYVDDFEGAVSYWTTGGTNCSWERGAPAGININTAASGTKVWKTKLTGYYNNSEASWVQGPCFDFSTIINPLMIFRKNVYSETSWDGAQVQYSIDGGTTWQLLGAYNDNYNWYNYSSVSGLSWTGSPAGWSGTAVSGWQIVGHSLQPLAGQPNVSFRVVWGTNSSINSYDGFAFDLFTITQAADLASVSPVSALNGCNLNVDTIRMYIKNVGPVAVTAGESMNLKYRVNTLPIVTELYTLTSNLVPGDSMLYTFSQTYAFAPGTYTVKLIADLLTDMVSANDTAQYTINLQMIGLDIMGGDTMHINPAFLPYSLSLINLGYTYTSYHWSNFDGSLTGTSSNFMATTLGWYYVTVTNAICTATDSILLDDLVSASLVTQQYGVKAYPNPATNSVNFNVHLRNSTDVTVQLLTAEGKIAETRYFMKASEINTVIDVSGYARGLYIIKVNYDNSTYIDKISLE